MGDELVNNHDSELTNVKYSDCMSIKQTEAKSFIQDESPLCKIVGPLDKIKWKQVYKGFNEFSPSINDKDEIIVVDTENHALRKIDPDSNIVTTIAGGHLGGDGDGGPATEAGLERPHGCGIDSSGIIYIADSNNHRVRIFSEE